VRHILPLLVLPLLATALAAPVPKEKTALKMKRLYGELADARKGYDFTLDGDKLVLTMGANASETLEEKNPPRVEREVKGNFEVRVAANLCPVTEKDKRAEIGDGFVGAGLCVWADDGRSFVFGPAISSRQGVSAGGSFRRDQTSLKPKEWYCSFDRYDPQQVFANRHYRITRSEKELLMENSEDGKKWEPGIIHKIALPETVRVGLVGVNVTTCECQATFSDFSLTTPKGEKK